MKELARILEKYKLRLEAVNRDVCAELSQRVRDRTPVLSGDLRDSWVVDPHPSQLKIGDTFRMGSDSPYVRYIEYLSPPARNHPTTKYADISQPYGMVRRTVAELPMIVAEAVKRHGG